VFGLGQALSDVGDQTEGLQSASHMFTIIDDAAMDLLKGLSSTGLDTVSTTKISGKIEFRDVSFSYGTRRDRSILNNCNFTILPGETVAFVGASGSG
jgi:ABC-type multidrug transport system fused ATPase/permease subunit